MELDVPGFDPLKVGVYDAAALTPAAAIFDTLTYLDDKGEVQPKLALFWTHSLPAISGRPPDPTRPLKGCSFAPRCRYATRHCHEAKPELKGAEMPGHLYACFHPIQMPEGIGAWRSSPPAPHPARRS